MKTVALGTTLTVADDSDNPTPVGNLTQISVPGPTKPEIDVTDFDSTASEFLAGLPDNGELSMTGFFNYENGGQAILLDDALASDAPVREFVIEFTRQSVSFTFNAFVKSFVPTAPGPNDAYGFDATLRVTGSVEVAPIS